MRTTSTRVTSMAPLSSTATTPPPEMAKALDRMRQVLDPVDGRSRYGAVVLRDAPDVESPDTQAPKSARYQEALSQVRQNMPLAAQQFQKLPARERAQYLDVRNALAKANNPVAMLSLQKMLFNGRLEGGKDLQGEGTLLQHLGDIARGEGLDSRVNKNVLLGDLVQEVATPSAIAQGERGTCAPTAVSIALNRDNPAEYARLMKGMASKSGQVELANGQSLVREQDTAFQADGSKRALTQRLLAPALMEMANGKSRNYHDSAPPNLRNQGANVRGVDQTYGAVFGRDMGFMQGQGSAWQDKAMGRIEQELGQGQDVLVGFDYKQQPDTGHKLLVTDLGEVGGEEYVKFINPWGDVELMEQEEFESRLENVNFDSAR